MSESQLVLIPVDGSDHSERAFECEYIASNMYIFARLKYRQEILYLQFSELILSWIL